MVETPHVWPPQRSDGALRPAQVFRLVGVALVDIQRSVADKNRTWPHAARRNFALRLGDGVGQADIMEISIECLTKKTPVRSQLWEDVLLDRTWAADHAADLARQEIDAAIYESWPLKTRVLLVKPYDRCSVQRDHPVARRIRNLSQRDACKRSIIHGPREVTEIELEQGGDIGEQEPGRKLVGGESQSAAGPLRLRLADHTHTSVVDRSCVISGANLISEMTGEQDDIVKAASRGLFRNHIEKAQLRRDFKQGLGSLPGQVPEPGSLSADEKDCLANRHDVTFRVTFLMERDGRAIRPVRILADGRDAVNSRVARPGAPTNDARSRRRTIDYVGRTA
jgi:hypothetical protein